MPGFFKGPLPQNYESTQEPSQTGAVAAQIDHVEKDGSIFIHVKNKMELDARLFWLDPEIREAVAVQELKDAKGGSVHTLHPGTDGWVTLRSDVTKHTKSENFAFLVLKKG